MKSYGETLSEEVIIEKILKSFTPQFDYIVVVVTPYFSYLFIYLFEFAHI